MKLSDYVIDFLAQHGVTEVFGISGGAAVHLFDSVARHPKVDYLCPQHEQSAAICADGYARATGRMGVAITTSGPGATNLLTGVCCSYYDSVPTLMLTGQVATYRLRGNRNVRQVGFQETDVVSIFSTVTKSAVQIAEATSIRYELEKAWQLALEGRPGPVLIDIPDDLQRADVHHAEMRSFTPDARSVDVPALMDQIRELLALLKKAKRPVIVLGGGLSTPRLNLDMESIIAKLGAPVALTWAGLDQLAHAHPLRIGPFGVYGPRLGNYAVQNADLIICLGSRLSQNLTGGILSSFARAARVAMVDASDGEMSKFDGRGINVHLRIHCQLREFFERLLPLLSGHESPGYGDWLRQISHWRAALPNDMPAVPADTAGYVDAYHFVDKLSAVVPEGENVFVDTGGNLTWTCNGFRIRRGQRLHSAWNNTPMGYALPAAIGAAVYKREPVTCVTGDGGLMLCLGELATVAKHNLPIRLVLFNNHGHGIQKQTLETWLGGHYVGVHGPSGLAFADFPRVAQAMDLKLVNIARTSDIEDQLRQAYANTGPVFINVEVNPDQKLFPVLKFGAALENQLPAMDSELIRREMIIDPFEPGRTAGAPVATAGV